MTPLKESELSAIKNRKVIKQERKENFFDIPPHVLYKKLAPDYIELFDSQKKIIETLNKHRFVVVNASRRLGKSETAAACIMAKIMEGDAKILVIAPNYTLTDIIWGNVINIVKRNNIKHQLNKKDKTLTVLDGLNSEVRSVSIMNKENIIGRGYSLVVIDEAAVIEDDTYFRRGLRPALATDINSRVLIISTPRGEHNYFKSYYDRGLSEEPKDSEWKSLTFPWYENPMLDEKEIMEDARETMSEAEWRQEFFCEFTVFENQIYNELVEDHLEPDLDKKGSFSHVIMGVDDGYTDDLASIVVGYNNENYAVLDAFKLNRASIEEKAKRIREHKEQYNVEHIFVDDGAAQLIAELSIRNLPAYKAGKGSVRDGINYVHGIIAAGKVKFDAEKAKPVFNALKAYRWKANADKSAAPQPHHDQNSHYADALRYALFTHRTKCGGTITFANDKE